MVSLEGTTTFSNDGFFWPGTVPTKSFVWIVIYIYYISVLIKLRN